MSASSPAEFARVFALLCAGFYSGWLAHVPAPPGEPVVIERVVTEVVTEASPPCPLPEVVEKVIRETVTAPAAPCPLFPWQKVVTAVLLSALLGAFGCLGLVLRLRL